MFSNVILLLKLRNCATTGRGREDYFAHTGHQHSRSDNVHSADYERIPFPRKAAVFHESI